jgi:hypothetical protein
VYFDASKGYLCRPWSEFVKISKHGLLQTEGSSGAALPEEALLRTFRGGSTLSTSRVDRLAGRFREDDLLAGLDVVAAGFFAGAGLGGAFKFCCSGCCIFAATAPLDNLRDLLGATVVVVVVSSSAGFEDGSTPESLRERLALLALFVFLSVFAVA